jgi:hypothetical protein
MQNFLHEEKIHIFVRLNPYMLLTTSVWKLNSLLANFPMVWKLCLKILFPNPVDQPPSFLPTRSLAPQPAPSSPALLLYPKSCLPRNSQQLAVICDLWFMVFWRFGGKGSLTQSLNLRIKDGCVCRTAPATPALLITQGSAVNCRPSPCYLHHYAQ